MIICSRVHPWYICTQTVNIVKCAPQICGIYDHWKVVLKCKKHREDRYWIHFRWKICYRKKATKNKEPMKIPVAERECVPESFCNLQYISQSIAITETVTQSNNKLLEISQSSHCPFTVDNMF